MEYPLKELFKRYLTDVRKVSTSSVNHYLDALNWISRYLVNKGFIRESIYEAMDIDKLEILAEILLSDTGFIDINRRGHQMYSAGLNNYMRFAHGYDFGKIGNQRALMDIPVNIPGQTESQITKWKRSGIIKEQTLMMAQYECEIDSDHKTFVAALNGKQYMEGHHIIPLMRQESFNKSLDIYANIVCLCPICHRLLHYGQHNDKDPVLNKIYYLRSGRLANSGIRLSKEEFINIVS